MKRKNYVDNLRWFCVCLLIPYHAAMAWNCWGEGNYIILGSDKVISSIVVAISPWYMTLLFVLAGISAKCSLLRRSNKQFVIERVQKLLLPLLIGTLTIVPVLTFYADKVNCGYRGGFIVHYLIFFTRWTDITGYDGGFSIGHLWFLLYLFVISTVALVIDLFLRRYISKFNLGNANVVIVVLFVLISMFAIPVKLGGKSILTYLLLYMIGYYFLSEERIIDNLWNFRYIFLVSWIVLTISNVYLFLWSTVQHEIWNTITMYFSGGFGIFTFLSFGKGALNKANRLTKWLSRNSFLIYIFHFLWVVVFEYYLSIIIDDTNTIFVFSVFGAFVITFLSCRIIKVENKVFVDKA